MPIRLLACCLLAFPAFAYADANDGNFMGFTLGTEYTGKSDNVVTSTSGNLLIETDDPTKPDAVQQVSVIVTPKSHNIGYIVAASWFPTEEEARAMARKYGQLLRAKYADWAFGRERMNANLDLAEVNFDKAPHNLQLMVVPDEHNGSSMWRFSMGLGWLDSTQEFKDWQALAVQEQASALSAEREAMIEDADTRGL